MTWEVRAQFAQCSDGSADCEWNAVLVDTKEAAESWWACRTAGRGVARVVHTMFNPQGEVVRVAFK